MYGTQEKFWAYRLGFFIFMFGLSRTFCPLISVTYVKK
jgi:hypothetical protein